MDGLKSQFADFKEQFEKVEHEIAVVNEDISRRDLEKEESLPKLAAEIERLRKTTFEVKDLKIELEKIQIEIQAKSTLLSSMDTEKKLKQLLTDLEGANANEEAVWLALKKVRDISGGYIDGGYTSGAEDEEFCTVINSESKDLMADFDNQGRNLKDLE
jgi:predicted  nucleic acid-binding Zn-ribbon protein